MMIGAEDFFALKNVSLEINSGERVGIIGANGAGKSTLLKALCRIYEPSSGWIAVHGNIAPLLEVGAGFHPEFTGRENLFFNGSILGFSKSDLKNYEEQIIKFAEIEQFIDTPVKYYSTGIYLRLAFSIATAVQPDILVLDELFAGGDASFIKKATERMNQMINKSNIMVMVSHDPSLLMQFCDRVICIEHGVVVDDGASKVVIDQYLKRSLG
ncbi:ABC transporter ATP-binding protein [Polynucleobacter sp. AP-Sving-400A-A2]|uniref:ABC transporter ATP-binding protein n=1 Tax=Polynucleobacter sp. AP-Sving-400A-A2 TaxID=2081049 RepID=UPI00203FB12A|nr:ABC transporter ATP-binding protein [Polynucleobacter sp. AP-Sving-400A-A2]QWE14868.1 ABC transporter ATP-binding protein [Polynucleobacter sp. AP-Sving-400A-A2]